MSLAYYRKEKIKKELEKKYNIDIAYSYNLARDLREHFSGTHYIIYNEYNENLFVDVVAKAAYMEYDECSTLTEKCISRARRIERMESSFKDDEKIYDEILDMEALWLVIGEISSFELLWGMEMSGLYHKDEKKVEKHNRTQNAFEYMYNLAMFYLTIAEDFVKKLESQFEEKQKLLIKKQNI